MAHFWSIENKNETEYSKNRNNTREISDLCKICLTAAALMVLCANSALNLFSKVLEYAVSCGSLHILQRQTISNSLKVTNCYVKIGSSTSCCRADTSHDCLGGRKTMIFRR